MEREFLEKCLKEGLSLREIGERVGKDHTTVGYWLKKYGLKAVYHDRYAPRGGIPAEVLEALVAAQIPVREMARELDRSDSTVRYWLDKYRLELPVRPGRRGIVRRAIEAGIEELPMECVRHGMTDHVLARPGRYLCRRCRSEAVARRRRRVKEILVREAGGQCQLCGYDRSIFALHFHHRDPKSKSFGLAQRGITRAIRQVREEAAKCVLLCANCHAEVEWGDATLPRAAARVSHDEPPPT